MLLLFHANIWCVLDLVDNFDCYYCIRSLNNFQYLNRFTFLFVSPTVVVLFGFPNIMLIILFIPMLLNWFLLLSRLPRNILGRGSPCGKGRDHPSRRAQPESGHFHTFSSFIISIGVRIFKAWCGRILLYVYTACLIRSSTWLKVSFPQSKSHPFLIVLFIRSANALCRGSPHCVMLMLICCAFNVSTYWFEQYWTPRSEWYNQPTDIYSVLSVK